MVRRNVTKANSQLAALEVLTMGPGRQRCFVDEHHMLLPSRQELFLRQLLEQPICHLKVKLR